MEKYYVQSGSLRTIVQAESAPKAALWAVHQAMQQILPWQADTDTGPQGKAGRWSQGGAVLGERIAVSRRGYDRDDADFMPTMQAVAQWSQLASTLDRLQRLLGRAA